MIDASTLTSASKVSVVPVDAKRMNFVKDVYLMDGLVHSDGNLRFLVFLDGARSTAASGSCIRARPASSTT